MKLSNEEFRVMLEGAVAGRHMDLETLLELYMPLINHYSMLNGKLDGDLDTFLTLRKAKTYFIIIGFPLKVTAIESSLNLYRNKEIMRCPNN